MDFAADAVFDVMAPPTRQPSRAPAPSDASEPSFDDHLDAATADEAPPTKETAKADDADADTESDTDAPDTAEPVVAAPSASTPAPTTSPHVIQIVATAAPEAEGAPVEAAAPIDAPAPAAPTAPTPPQQNTAPEADADDAAVGTTPAPSQPKSDTAAKAAPDTAPKADANVTQNDTGAEQAALANAAATQSVATQQTETPAPDAADTASLPPPAAAQPAQSAPQPQRGAKTQSTRDGKAIEVDGETKSTAAEQIAPQPHQAAKSTANTGEKNASAVAPVTVESSDTAATSPLANPASALTQTPTQTQASAAVDHTAATRAAPAANQVAREIIRRFDGENTRFELRLDPPDLGRIDVRLEVSRDNRVSAVISADSPQALNDLSRHARDLEAALQSAGLELGDSGLSFDLRQGDEGSNQADSGSSARGRAASDDTQQQAAPAARPLGYERWRGVRVDVMV